MSKTISIILLSTIFGGLFGSYLTIAAYDRLPWAKSNSFDKAIERSFVDSQQDSSVIDVVNKVSPAVVSIVIERDVNSDFQVDPFFQNFWPFFSQPEPNPQDKEPDYKKVGGGTGFIISADGFILTNKHVVNLEGARYKVVLNNGTEYEAKVVGTDLFNDIGALKIEVKDLPVVDLGDSDKLVIGQSVVAIGNALAEFSNTVTTGVVSGMGRSIVASDSSGSSEKLEDVIQTDAAINPGNSGGPLLNLKGQVIGINTAISGNGQLIGFAIPINSAKSIIEGLKKSGEIVRPYLGVRYVMLNKEISEINKIEFDYGALISRGDDPKQLAILPGSPADKAALVENDIILEVNDKKLTEDYDLAKAISSFMPGDSINLKVSSKGEIKNVKVILEKYNG